MKEMTGALTHVAEQTCFLVEAFHASTEFRRRMAREIEDFHGMLNRILIFASVYGCFTSLADDVQKAIETSGDAERRPYRGGKRTSARTSVLTGLPGVSTGSFRENKLPILRHTA